MAPDIERAIYDRHDEIALLKRWKKLVFHLQKLYRSVRTEEDSWAHSDTLNSETELISELSRKLRVARRCCREMSRVVRLRIRDTKNLYQLLEKSYDDYLCVIFQ